MTSKHFIALVVGLAMAVTSLSARPAKAMSEDDLAKLLFGAGALVIIGMAASQNKSNRHDAVPVTRRPVEPIVVHPHKRPGRYKPAAMMPRHCLREVTTWDKRDLLVYGQRCLRNADIRVNRLPSRCRVQSQLRNGRTITGYRARCMKREGYAMRRR